MSMFAKRVTQVVVVKDGDKDVNVTVRKLSGKSLANASENRQIAAANVSRKLGAELIKAYQEERTAKKDAEPEKPKDLETAKKQRYASYDRDTVLTAGVAAWDAVDSEGKPVPVNNDTLSDLDEPTANKLHEAIIDLSLGPVDPAELEAAKGKD